MNCCAVNRYSCCDLDDIDCLPEALLTITINLYFLFQRWVLDEAYRDRQGNLNRSQAILARFEIQKTEEIIEWREARSLGRLPIRPLHDLSGAERLQENKDKNINVTQKNSSRADTACREDYSSPALTRRASSNPAEIRRQPLQPAPRVAGQRPQDARCGSRQGLRLDRLHTRDVGRGNPASVAGTQSQAGVWWARTLERRAKYVEPRRYKKPAPGAVRPSSVRTGQAKHCLRRKSTTLRSLPLPRDCCFTRIRHQKPLQGERSVSCNDRRSRRALGARLTSACSR
jgi:hypothetical protein